jgi:hypothetical protein
VTAPVERDLLRKVTLPPGAYELEVAVAFETAVFIPGV